MSHMTSELYNSLTPKQRERHARWRRLNFANDISNIINESRRSLCPAHQTPRCGPKVGDWYEYVIANSNNHRGKK
jgi:hypothetical protein